MSRGKRLSLANGRRLVSDLTRIAGRIPAVGISGEFDLSSLDRLRRFTRPKISWNVLYMKAYSLVAEKIPELRQSYVKFPWPHLYEHGSNVCMMAINRVHAGENRLFFARFHNPHHVPLLVLQSQYENYLRAPVQDIRQFRHQIRFAQAPSWVRSLAWAVMFHLWPSKRATHVGTMGMSFSGFRNVYGNRHLGPMTSVLGVDPLPRSGKANVLFTFDHRILDGLPATSVLQNIHQAMMTRIKDELAQMVQSADFAANSEAKVA